VLKIAASAASLSANSRSLLSMPGHHGFDDTKGLDDIMLPSLWLREQLLTFVMSKIVDHSLCNKWENCILLELE
jgi:hypothetical protein